MGPIPKLFHRKWFWKAKNPHWFWGFCWVNICLKEFLNAVRGSGRSDFSGDMWRCFGFSIDASFRQVVSQRCQWESALKLRESNLSHEKWWVLWYICIYIYIYSGQIIATSAEVTPTGSLVGGSFQNRLNSGLGIIVLCLDIYIYIHYIYIYISLRDIYNLFVFLLVAY